MTGQHPLAKAYFITLEDESGHIPLIVWPAVYQRFKSAILQPFLAVKGAVSRRDGTLNVVVTNVAPLDGLRKPPEAKNWG